MYTVNFQPLGGLSLKMRPSEERRSKLSNRMPTTAQIVSGVVILCAVGLVVYMFMNRNADHAAPAGAGAAADAVLLKADEPPIPPLPAPAAAADADDASVEGTHADAGPSRSNPWF